MYSMCLRTCNARLFVFAVHVVTKMMMVKSSDRWRCVSERVGGGARFHDDGDVSMHVGWPELSHRLYLTLCFKQLTRSC